MTQEDGVRARRREQGRNALLEAARQRYRDGEAIDLATLAAEQGVSRATAYRWIGGNDQLLAAVLRARARELWAAHVAERSEETGAERVVAVISDFLHHVDESKRFRVILEADPARAMSIVASGAHPNQQVVIGLVQDLIQEEVDRGHLSIGWEPHTLAYAIVRIFEAFLYGDIVAGEHQDLDRAVEIIDILVRSTPTPR
ncbi:MAG TPA: QsdR family transcriptional regulator [Pseudonocardia sp.]|jgi:AcrR family transcriptional regulator|nr:QsdR family transcriptional regulator [Pseudonocardia sp.]